MRQTQNLSGAFWCDTEKDPRWSVLPFSAFDNKHRCPDSMVEFRTSLDYSGKGELFLRFTAGCRFRLLINGRFAEDGPVEIGGDYGKKDAPNWWFHDEKEISAFLHAGKNELLFQTFPAGITQTDYTLGFGWLWCAVRKKEPWKVLQAPCWQWRVNPFYRESNRHDFQCGETPWQSGCRPAAVPLASCSLELPALAAIRRTDFRIRFPFPKSGNLKMRGKSLRISAGDPVTFYLLFPEVRAGFFEVTWSAGHAVSMHFDFQEIPGVSQMQNEFLQSGDNDGSFRTVKLYSFRAVQVTLTPSRLSFSANDDAGETLLSFAMIERHFPLRRKSPLPRAARRFGQIDDLCARNITMCMQRMHWDSPVHQEGLGCIADYRIEALAEYALFRESRLAAADLQRTALLLRQQKKLFHTSFELCYILMCREYVDFTGNDELAASCYDVLRQIYRRFCSFTGPTGLLSDAENYLFIDWTVDGKYNWHHPPASRGTGAMTALWYAALLALSRIAGRLGKPDDQARYGQKAREVREAFNRELWDPRHQAYRDGIPGLSRRPPDEWLPAEDGRESRSSLTAIMALACGLPGKEQSPEKLLAKVMRGGLPLRPSVYYCFYLFEAIEQIGMWKKYGPELLARWKVFAGTGIRETWNAGDYSHGWGASPAIFLRRHPR